LMMVSVGLVGCGAQELPGGSHDAGRDVGRSVVDATEGNLDDAGCPPEGKIACGPYGCPGSGIVATPECVNGVWSCPILLIDLICPADAGASVDAGQTSRDADASCNPAPPFLPCGTCGSDTTTRPVCVDGTWSCAPGLLDVRTCPTTIPKCVGPQPAGCFCNPITGVLICAQDAGADRPS